MSFIAMYLSICILRKGIHKDKGILTASADFGIPVLILLEYHLALSKLLIHSHLVPLILRGQTETVMRLPI